MRRLGRLLLWALALMFLAATVAIIIEGARPGLSPLFAWTATIDPAPLSSLLRSLASAGGAFEVATLFHIILGAVAAWWVVLSGLRTGARRGQRIAGWLRPPAAVFAALALAAPLVDSAWVQSLEWHSGIDLSPLDSQAVGSILLKLSSPLLHWSILTAFLIAAGAILLAKSRTERRLALVVSAVALAILAVQVSLWWAEGLRVQDFSLVPFAGLPILAFAAFLQSDGDKSGHPHVIVGSVTLIAASFYISAQASQGLFAPEDTLLMTAAAYSVPYGLAIFVGLAVLDLRWQPTVPRGLIWGHAMGLAVIGSFAVLPYASQALVGVPRRSLDMQHAETTVRFMLANAQLLLVVWILAGVYVMSRYRQRQTEGPPLPPDRRITNASQLAA